MRSGSYIKSLLIRQRWILLSTSFTAYAVVIGKMITNAEFIARSFIERSRYL